MVGNHTAVFSGCVFIASPLLFLYFVNCKCFFILCIVLTENSWQLVELKRVDFCVCISMHLWVCVLFDEPGNESEYLLWPLCWDLAPSDQLYPGCSGTCTSGREWQIRHLCFCLPSHHRAVLLPCLQGNLRSSFHTWVLHALLAHYITITCVEMKCCPMELLKIPQLA